VIWTGSDDGLVQLTQDNGQTWANVTPKDMPEWVQINQIKASPFDPGTAYFAAVNYKNDDVAAAVKKLAPKGIDTIVEVNLQANAELDEKIITRGGTIVSYASDGDDRVSLPIGAAMGRNVRLRFLLTYTVSDDEKQDALGSVSEALAAGVLGAGEEAGLPITRFTLEETAAAHDAVESGVVGKVLIDVTQ
jgi:NADPH2:quinone reductase